MVLTDTPDISSLSHFPPTISKSPAWKKLFAGERSDDEDPICVYEVKLDPDGGPSEKRSVRTCFLVIP